MKKIWLVMLTLFTTIILFSCTPTASTTSVKVEYYVDGTSYRISMVEQASTITLPTVENSAGWFKDASYTDGPYVTYKVLYGLTFYTYTKQQTVEIINEGIATLGEYTPYSMRDTVFTLMGQYNALSESEKAEIENFELLNSLYTKFIGYQTTVNDLIQLIDSIVVSTSAKDDLVLARETYNGLSIELKQYITNYQTLVSKEKDYQDNYAVDLSTINAAIKRLPYIVSYLDKEAVEPLINQYNALSNTDKAKLTNAQYLEYWISKFNQIEGAKSIVIYPKGYFASMSELNEALAYAFYKYVDENKGRTYLTNNGINSISDMINAFNSQGLKTNTINEVFFVTAGSNLLSNELGGFVGYCYKNDLFVDCFKSLIGTKAFVTDDAYFLSSTADAIDYTSKLLTGKYSSTADLRTRQARFGNIASSNIYTIVGYYTDSAYQNATTSTSGMRYAKIVENDKINVEIDYYNSFVSAYGKEINLTQASSISLQQILNTVDPVVVSQLDAVETIYKDYFKVIYNYQPETIDHQQALASTAEAYYIQHTQITYDQYSYRRMINLRAEEATDEFPCFLDCSSYASTVFYHTFGEQIYGYPVGQGYQKTATYSEDALANKYGYTIASGYLEDYPDDASRQAKINEIKPLLQAGDMLVYRHGASSPDKGHIMVYSGNQTFYHSTGTSMQVGEGIKPSTFDDKQNAAEKSEGTVKCESWDVVFKSSGARYLFKQTSSDTFWNFAFFRPVLAEGLTLTEEAINHYYNRDILIEKTASIHNYNTLLPGEEVTFTVTVQNLNSASRYLEMEEIIPEYFSYVSSEGIYANGKIYQVANVAAKGTVTFSYTLKLNANAPKGTRIALEDTRVNGIYTNTLITYVAGVANIDTISTAVINDTETNADTLTPIYNAYATQNITLPASTTEEMMAYFVDIANKQLDFTKPMSNAYIMYTGYNISPNYMFYHDRMLRILPCQLEEGDVILTYDHETKKYQSYYYKDISNIYAVNASGKMALLYSTEATVNKFLIQTYAYKASLVFRPSVIK